MDFSFVCGCETLLIYFMYVVVKIDYWILSLFVLWNTWLINWLSLTLVFPGQSNILTVANKAIISSYVGWKISFVKSKCIAISQHISCKGAY